MKSKVLFANAICWSGAALCSLILTYGTHGPARHPKMIMISLIGMVFISVVNQMRYASRGLAIVNALLWAIAFVVAGALVHSPLGDGVHPVTMTIVLVVLGLISQVVISVSNVRNSSDSTSD